MMKIVMSLAAMLVCVSAGVARAEGQDVVDYRQHLMKTLGEQSQVLGMIMQGRAPATNVLKHAELLAITASMLEAAFKEKVVSGEAKPEVWDNWGDFSKRMQEFAAGTTELLKSVQANNGKVMEDKVGAALNCKSCHDLYRKPRQRG